MGTGIKFDRTALSFTSEAHPSLKFHLETSNDCIHIEKDTTVTNQFRFFRNSLVLTLMLFSTGCYGVSDYCENGTTGLWIDGLGVWLNLALQSGAVGFLITLIVSFFLYRLQTKRVEQWVITQSPNTPPSLPSWLIPTILIIVLLLPFLIFLPLICSMRWAHVVGMCLGSVVAWGIVFKLYYLNKLNNLT